MDRRTQTFKEVKLATAVENLSKILIKDHGTEKILQQVMDYLVDELAVADVCIVWKYEPATRKLFAVASSGIDIKLLSQVRLDPNTHVIGRVFQSRKSDLASIDRSVTVDANDIEKELGYKYPCSAYRVAAVCKPLFFDSKRYGVLLFLNLKQGTVFKPKARRLFQVTACLLALFLKMDAVGKARKEMKALGDNEKYKAGVISNLAHEMRTPLTSIKGFSTALLMKEIVYSSEKQREFLEIIDQECDILEDLISDHLESSIIDAGMMKIDLQPVRLPRLAEKAADDIGRRFPKHSLLVDFADDFPLVDADPERILQVFRQLLDNAAKYSPRGGWIVMQGAVTEDEAVVSVSDEGVGIAPEDLNHLFDRFFRAKASTGAQVIGTGLGLPICRAIIETHGGRIWAESQPGHGSKFCISLPLKGPSRNLAD